MKLYCHAGAKTLEIIEVKKHGMKSRRQFLQSVTMGGLGLALLPAVANAACFFDDGLMNADDLYGQAGNLLDTWVDALLKSQIINDKTPALYGGLMCPACKRVHGRVADSIYPLVHMAHKKQDSRYMEAAKLLYQWMEQNVSEPDGSWKNETYTGAWKGITVFTTIALADTLKHYGNTLEPGWKTEIECRVKKAGEFIYNNFSMDYGNINYPISAAYALTLLGIQLNIPAFIKKGKFFADESLKFFSTHASFIYGEGGPYYTPSKKGCFSVDLGYNMEESLPAMVFYGQLVKNQVLLQKVHQSLQTHLQFMLPDGGMDNSWGTRSFKWTYWGSRTSDGCHAALALMAHKDERYYKAAFLNLQLLKQCTHNGLLHGGLHYVSAGVQPCIHHTFCHAKSLAALSDYGRPFKLEKLNKIKLPVEENYGFRFFKDIQTWLITKGGFRATVTGYDREYTFKEGHPTGGALSLLWHAKTGPVIAASMIKYQMHEAGNMQPDTNSTSIPLTPRIQLKLDGKTYTNIADLSAQIVVKEQNGLIIADTISAMVDGDQNNPPTGSIKCNVKYTFSNRGVRLAFSFDSSVHNNQVQIVVPVISASTEKVHIHSEKEIKIIKPRAVLHITTNQPITPILSTTSRVFNFVPGLQAVPLYFTQREVEINIQIS